MTSYLLVNSGRNYINKQKLKMLSAYYLETNGAAEHINKTFNIINTTNISTDYSLFQLQSEFSP